MNLLDPLDLSRTSANELEALYLGSGDAEQQPNWAVHIDDETSDIDTQPDSIRLRIGLLT